MTDAEKLIEFTRKTAKAPDMILIEFLNLYQDGMIERKQARNAAKKLDSRLSGLSTNYKSAFNYERMDKGINYYQAKIAILKKELKTRNEK